MNSKEDYQEYFRKYQRKYRQRPEVKAKQREYNQKPERKARQREYNKKPEAKAKQREYRQKPEVKAKQREYHKKYRQKPEVKAKQKEYRQTPEYKEKKKVYLESNRDKISKNSKKWYEKNKDKVKERIKEYDSKNKDKRKKYIKEYLKKYQNNIDYKYKIKFYHLKRNYNINEKTYYDILSSQNNKCAICNDDFDINLKNTHIDHSHDTNKIRGILCCYCNTLLGYSKENIRILNSAIAYLIKPNKYYNLFKSRRKNGLKEFQKNGMFLKLLNIQNNKCAICDEELNKTYVDHSHNTGEVRGILCINCNSLIGRCRDNPKILKSAICYLEKHLSI